MKKIFHLFLIFSTLFLTGCFEKESAIQKATKEKKLLVGNHTDPRDLDPQLVTSVPEQKIMVALFEGLVSMHPETLEPVPGVAQSWGITPDGKTYTFKIRPNAKWSNGEIITAYDFVESYKRILNPNLASENTSLLYVLEGAQEYNTGEISDFAQVGVRAMNNHTLQIKLKNVTPYFLSLLAHNAWAPVPIKTIEQYGSITQRPNTWTQPGNQVSNGPFILKEWISNDHILVEKNPLYWDAENVKINSIEFFPISSANAEEIAFRGNRLHLTDSIPQHKKEKYIKENSPFFKTHPYLGTEYYIFNTELEIFKDVRIRQALSLAIDRQALSTNVISKDNQAAYHFTPPNLGKYTSSTNIRENIAKAKQLLTDAGYPNGEGFPNVELLFNTSDKNKLVAEAIQQMWKKNLSIQINLVGQESKVCLNRRKEGDFQILRASWIGDYLDPSTFLNIFSKDSYNNYSQWENDAYNTLIEQAASTVNADKRIYLFQKAEAILLDESPIMPLYFYSTSSLVQTNVKGYYPNILDFHPYQHIELE